MTHVANRFAAVLDANVLYPFRVRDLLLRFAEAGLFRACWSRQILDEWQLSLLASKPQLEVSIRSQRLAMEEAFGLDRSALQCRLRQHGQAQAPRQGSGLLDDALGDGFGAFLQDACTNLVAVTKGTVYIAMSGSDLHTI